MNLFHRRLRTVVSAVALLLPLTLSIGCSSRPVIPVGEVPRAQPPTADERTVSLAAVQKEISDGNFKPVRNPVETRRVQNVVDRLARAAGASGFTYPVMVVDAGKEVNAAAVNGATILVYEELLRRVPRDEELATILGHEVGHILAKHHADTGEQERAAGVEIFSAVVGTAASIGAAVAGAGAGAADIAGDLSSGVTSAVGHGAITLSYSRDMEREADHVGLMLMSKAGYNPRAAIEFWKHSDEILGGGSGIAFFSTHPSNDDRLERLQEALPIAEKYYATAGPAPSTEPTRSEPKATKKAKKKK